MKINDGDKIILLKHGQPQTILNIETYSEVNYLVKILNNYYGKEIYDFEVISNSGTLKQTFYNEIINSILKKYKNNNQEEWKKATTSWKLQIIQSEIDQEFNEIWDKLEAELILNKLTE